MTVLEKKEIVRWSKMGPRAMFGQFMLELAQTDLDIIVMSADLGRSSGLDRFKKYFPEKYISVGISEQNLIGVAAGLAKEGHKVFVTSFAPFLSMRASEQIRMNLGYMELGVNVVALGSGLSMGFLGNSHYGLEDLAIMRAIPNLNVSSPADCLELKKILFDYAYNNRGGSYIRLTGIPGSPLTYENDYEYEFSKPIVINEGEDILIIGTGSILGECKIAVELLLEHKVKAKLLNVNTIKPLHGDVLNCISLFKKVVIVEEHMIIGGLYSTICEKIGSLELNPKLLSISLPCNFGPTGKYDYLINYYGLTGNQITKKIISFI